MIITVNDTAETVMEKLRGVIPAVHGSQWSARFLPPEIIARRAVANTLVGSLKDCASRFADTSER